MENQITEKKPLDYVKTIFRRKWLIILPTVIGIVGGIVSANTLPKSYESSTLVLVEEGRVINPLLENLAVSTSVAKRLGVLREQILGWDRLNQLISALDLAKDVRDQQGFEDLVKHLRRNIIVRLRGNNNIVSISYEDKNAEQAMNIVKTITDIFIAENLRQQNSETDNAITFINDQLALYQKKLKQGEIANLEDKLNKLLLDSTEKHPMVIELRKQLEAAKQEMALGNYEIKNEEGVAKSDEELATLKEELKSIKEELATASIDTDKGGENRTKLANATNEKLYKLLLLDKIDEVATQDADVNRRLYTELLQRLETAKITQRLESSKEGTRYTILDPARLPLKAAKPNKIMVLLMGMFCGAGAGIGLVFLTEMMDKSFLGVDDAKGFLELPILGAISKIITQEDVKVQRLRNAAITSVSVVIGIALIIVIIFNIVLGS